jgi:exonuclease VII small subunit
LLALADKKTWPKVQGKPVPGNGYSNTVGHWSSHKEYSDQVGTYLDERLRELRRDYGDLDKALKDPTRGKQLRQEINQTMQDAQQHFRDLINNGGAPNRGGRISWDNDQTPPTA